MRDWPCRSGEPPWPLDPKDHPKPKPDLVAPADSTGASSPDEGKQRRKKKKHHCPRKAELKVTTWGLGTDYLVWTNTGSAGGSSLTASSHSEGDSGLGSNFWVTDTEPRTRAPLRASPDARRDPTEVIEDAPLSDRGDADEDTEMVDAEVIEAERPNDEGGPAPRRLPEPEEVPEQVPDLPEENPEEVAGEGDPQVPQDPQDEAPQPYRQVLQSFQTVAQTFSAAYGNASTNIQQVIRRCLGIVLMTTGLSSTVPLMLSIAGLNPSVQQWPADCVFYSYFQGSWKIEAFSLCMFLLLPNLREVPHGTKGTGPKFVTRPVYLRSQLRNNTNTVSTLVLLIHLLHILCTRYTGIAHHWALQTSGRGWAGSKAVHGMECSGAHSLYWRSLSVGAAA